VAWQKSPEELVARFGRVMDRFPDVKRRQMFGYPAATVGGNLATSLHQRNWIVRLAADDQDAAIRDGGAPFEPMPGRAMKGFVSLPPSALTDDDAIAAWVERAIEHTRTLPSK
jgi:TfoX/Sxy family transcriptional regulator of competence genes